MLDEISSPIDQELSPGEKILWSAQPRPGIRLRGTDIFFIPFSIMWCGFAVFWETAVLTSKGAPFFFALWGVPFVLVGLHMVFGRFVVDALGRAHTFYGLTNERIIIVTGLLSRRTKSLNLRTLSDISLTQRRDGSGTITFGPAYPMANWFPSGSWPGSSQHAPPAFDMIDQAKEVYDLVRQTQKAAP